MIGFFYSKLTIYFIVNFILSSSSSSSSTNFIATQVLKQNFRAVVKLTITIVNR